MFVAIIVYTVCDIYYMQCVAGNQSHTSNTGSNTSDISFS